MKIIIMLSMIISFTTINAQASQWVLWKHDHSSAQRGVGSNNYDAAATENPIPISEHKSLKECNDASKNMVDSKVFWLNSNHAKNIIRTISPDGVRYEQESTFKEQGYFSIYLQFRCYPYHIVPSKAHFNSS